MKAQKKIYEMTDRELRAYKRKARIQREIRRRCLMVIMTVCLIATCAVSYHSIISSANEGENPIQFKYYKSISVAYGETLWEITDQYIDYDQYADKNKYIAEVRHINHLDEDESIIAGQRLIVPYYSEEYIR